MSRFGELNARRRYRPGDSVVVADGRSGVVTDVRAERLYDVKGPDFVVTQHEDELLPNPRPGADASQPD